MGVPDDADAALRKNTQGLERNQFWHGRGIEQFGRKLQDSRQRRAVATHHAFPGVGQLTTQQDQVPGAECAGVVTDKAHALPTLNPGQLPMGMAVLRQVKCIQCQSKVAKRPIRMPNVLFKYLHYFE